MSGQLKISFVLLVSVAMTLSACNQTRVQGNHPEVNRSALTPQAIEPPNTQSPVRQPSQTLNQDQSIAQTFATSVQVNRENYKPIALSQFTDRNTLIGNDPKAIALAAFGDIDSEGGSRDVSVKYPQSDRAIVLITQTGVADDSVRGMRYLVELAPIAKASQTGKQWEIVWAGSQFTCQPGRGHQDWSTQLCQ
ncbi:MAG: hypothetical protein AB1589_15770 [Cyanobacteriota bacterium]